eukprot:GEMP01058039.1.p1 GENE.GEMP01058039.1~~GEMP01058039.1.p1  ORF type:complete len:404 (+),score=73.87 GEMP01058039.1:147-1358(+)
MDETSLPSVKRQKMKLTGYEWYKSIGKPKHICSPMVDQSELAFRMLTRQYGVDLAYTPMFHSRLFSEQAKYREKQFSTCPGDDPLIVQFCGDDPQTILNAAKYVETQCSAVDINLGCPQGIARKGHYGSFLLTETDLLVDIVSTLNKHLAVPVTVKMRKVSRDLQDTLKLCYALQGAGASAICIHGRTKEEKGQSVGLVDWESCKIIKQRMEIPVFVNGGIETYDDVVACFQATGCDAVMSSEALLETPSLFSNTPVSQDQLTLEYLDYCEKYNCLDKKHVKSHLFRFLYAGLQYNTDLRSELGQSRTFDEMRKVATTLAERRKEKKEHPDKGWYRRYRNPLGFDKGRTPLRTPRADHAAAQEDAGSQRGDARTPQAGHAAAQEDAGSQRGDAVPPERSAPRK